MFKLLRDSIFSPKKIIHYRAKKVWFVILYMLLVSSIMGITMFAKVAGSDTGLDYTDRKEMTKLFNDNNAYIADGIFYSDESFTVDIYNITIAFLGTNKELKDLKATYQLVIKEDTVNVVANSVSGAMLYKLKSITEVSESFKNVDLKNITATDEFFDTLDDVIGKLEPGYFYMMFFYGLFNGIIYMLGYALITYFFLLVMFRAGKYMKKGQLFKMLIFASTLVVIVESLCLLLNFGSLLSFIALLVAFIPLYVLEKEFALRIKMREIGEKALNNPSVIDKINEAMGRTKNEEEKNSSDEDENE